MSNTVLRVMVLAGGPDREKAVSLMSATEVSGALRRAGHEVRQQNIQPDDLSALEDFIDWGGDVIFPALHGDWGEGGGLQTILEARGLSFVGCGARAADVAMDKHRAKMVMLAQDLPTPEFELIDCGQRSTITPPLVYKPLREGSSIDTVVCTDSEQAILAAASLSSRHTHLLVERFITGRELTVSTLAISNRLMALPPIQIVPATGFYDYDAKYVSDDTQYYFEIDLPTDVLAEVSRLATQVHRALGCRHMGRVDFIVDQNNQPWILELNTIPGFTTHSLLPMAADRAGLPLPKLVDGLVRMAAADVKIACPGEILCPFEIMKTIDS